MDLILFGLGRLKALLQGTQEYNDNDRKTSTNKEKHISSSLISRASPLLKKPLMHVSTATVLSLMLIFVSCSEQKEMPADFQENQPAGYKITDLTKGYGALEDAYDSIDAGGTNDRLTDAIDNSESDFEISSYGFSDTLSNPAVPLQELIRTDLAALVGKLVDPSARHHEKSGVDAVFEGTASQNRENFYAFLDKVDSDGVQVPDDYISGMLYRLLDYLSASIPGDPETDPDKEWLKKQADDLKEDVQDVGFQEDFVDITKLLTKLLIQTDYPVWVDAADQPVDKDYIDPGQHRSLGLGNAVRGTIDLATWLNRAEVDPETRELLHGLIKSAANILDPTLEDGLGLKLRRLVENLEVYFTKGGAIYEVDPIYSENSAERYSDSELGQTIREMAPVLQQLFVRSDRDNAMIKKTDAPVYPLELMVENLRSIGFDPDTIDVERSIDDLLHYDLWGRNRKTNSDAYPASMLESLLFLTQLTANHGWKDGGNTTEIVDADDVRSLHGHGAYTEELTLSDSLFSIHMRKDNVQGTLSIYDLAFNAGSGNNIYRSKNSFTLAQVNDLYDGYIEDDSGASLPDDVDYRFFYNQDYGVLNFLAGPGLGDLGAPDGGNPNGWTSGSSTGAELMNKYRGYSPNGMNEGQLAAWTMGWGVRACFGGEGPYYYADPDAETVTVNGQLYRKYLRPDGRIYAYVSLDGEQYLYPQDPTGGDVADDDSETPLIDGQPQRDNRYKAQWHSDSYMIRYQADLTTAEYRYATVDNSSGDAVAIDIDSDDLDHAAGRLTYNELVAENDPARACASPEEAFYRNFQWLMTEKKMVLVIPMYLNYFNYMESGLFEIMECNGYAGLANLRKYAANHYWAKKQTTGISEIPGDYRMEVVSKFINIENSEDVEKLMGPEAVYDIFTDCGTSTPAIVGHNLPALYRVAFPLSPTMNRGNDITDKVLGSKEFVVGDANWNNRNAFPSILFSLLAGLRENTPDIESGHRPDGIDSGMRTFLNQTALLTKPLFYYNKASATKAPQNSLIPRVAGSGADEVYQGLPFLRSGADFYDTGLPETYYGSDRERAFYQPAQIRTLLNVMIDSDLTETETRCDGILPLVTQTRTLTNLFKMVLHPSNEGEQTTLLQQFLSGMEQIVTAMKFSKGPMTKINASPESGKDLVYPDWMFSRDVNEDATGAYTAYSPLAVRQDDIDLDEILDFIIGQDTFDANGDGSIDPDEEGDGLADFPDCRAENSGDPVPNPDSLFCKPHADEYDRTWEDFYDLADTLGDLLHEDLPNEDRPSCITQNLLYIMDRFLARDQRYTSEEISGMLYSIGKLFGHYDAVNSKWVYQGEGEPGFNDIYNMLTVRVPAIHDAVVATEMDPAAATAAGGASAGFYGYGDHYYSQLLFIAKMTGSDGLVQFLLNTVTAPQRWGDILDDANFFLSTCPDIIASDSELWPTVVQLLQDMGGAIGRTKNSDAVNDVISDYGFQVN